jgi:regulator of protease activity HflC (stomatin/prohibitin superfamily)
MFGFKRIVVGDGERGLLYRERRLVRVLMPGVHKMYDPRGRFEVQVGNILQPEYAGRDVEAVIEALGERVEQFFILADIGANEIGLLMKNGRIEDVLPPGSRKLFWRGPVRVEVERVPIGESLEVRGDIAQRLRMTGALGRFALVATVLAEHVGLLFIDGRLVRTLDTGVYAFWNFQKNVAVEVADLRIQAMEVSGQELLTRDKVTLRVNLAATLRVVDAVASRTKVVKFSDQVYRELQYGLRKAVSAKTLDEMLGDKASLDADIFAAVREQVAQFGVELLGVGVKDVILPGEMREILNAVVQAEKSAQANVVRRREEANATRSLLNTARLLEESPVLMRLKELEALEKIVEKIDKLTVFGGLDGVLKQLVNIKH